MAEKEKEQRNKATIAQNERLNKDPDNWWRNSPTELDLTRLTCLKRALEDLKREVDEVTSRVHQTNSNYYVGSSSNAAPATVHGGTGISTNQVLFDRNGMTSPIDQTLPFGFNVMNRTPAGYNHSQIQNHEFKQAHPYHGPRYY